MAGDRLALQRYFDQGLASAQDPIQLLGAVQKAVKHTKSKLIRHTLKIPTIQSDLRSLIRGLTAELQEELAELAKRRDYESALQLREKLEKKLSEVQESISGLQPSALNDAGKRPVRGEERRKLMQEEDEKRHEAAIMARRLRREQEEREQKRIEAQLLLQKQEQQSVRLAAESAQRREQEAIVQKHQQLEVLRAQSLRRKQYLESLKDLPTRPPVSRTSLSEPRTSNRPSTITEPGKGKGVTVQFKRYRKSPFLLRLEHEEYDQLRTIQEESMHKKKRMEMQKHYAEIVQEMFAPAVDMMKRKEIELIRQRELCQLSVGETRRKSNSVQKYSASTSVSSAPTPIRAAAKKSQSITPPPRMQPNFLATVKKELDHRIRRLLDCSPSKTPQPSSSQQSAYQYEKRAQARSAVLKRLDPLSPAALQLEEDADELLLHSVKAKIALLEE